MQAGVLTPVLLWLLSSEVPEAQVTKSLRSLESFLVRRMVCRMTTRGYNLLFIGLVGALERAGEAQAGGRLLSSTSETRRRIADGGPRTSSWRIRSCGNLSFGS